GGAVYTTGAFWDTVDFDPGPGTFSLTSAGAADGFVVKLDGGGNLAWARQLGGTLGDAGSGLAVDAGRPVYTTAVFSGPADLHPRPCPLRLTSAGRCDAFVGKLDGAGNLGWARPLGGTGPDYGSGLAVNRGGAVYTTGFFVGTADFDPGPGTFPLTSAGA